MNLMAICNIDAAGPEPQVDALLDRKWFGKNKEVAGPPLGTDLNLLTVLEGDSRLQGRLRFNEFKHRALLDGALISDVAEVEIKIWLARVYRLVVSTKQIHELLPLVASRHKYHPVKDYLSGLTWDHRPRVGQMLTNYYGAQDRPIYRRIGTCWLLSSVARIFSPGCQVDTVTILGTTEEGVGEVKGAFVNKAKHGNVPAGTKRSERVVPQSVLWRNSDVTEKS